jgi:hypothetical protein
MKKLVACLFVALAMVVGAVSFAQAETVTLSGEKGQVDLFAAELQSNGVASSNIVRNYGEPAMGRYNGKKWPGVRYQLGSDPSEDGWVPISNDRAKKGTLCRLQQAQAKNIADVARTGGGGRSVPQAVVLPSAEGAGAICSGRECWPYDGSKGITIDLRCPVMVNGQAVRTVVMPRKDLRGNNNIGAKVEYHNRNDYWWSATGWGPVIVFYNVNQDPNALMTPQKRGIIEAHLRKIVPMKAGQGGEEGDACYDLVLNENGSVLFQNK